MSDDTVKITERLSYGFIDTRVRWGDGAAVDFPSSKIPPFFVTQTLLGFGGGPDLNRVSLNLPNHEAFVLCKMNEPRTPEQRDRWHRLAAELSKLWLSKTGD